MKHTESHWRTSVKSSKLRHDQKLTSIKGKIVVFLQFFYQPKAELTMDNIVDLMKLANKHKVEVTLSISIFTIFGRPFEKEGRQFFKRPSYFQKKDGHVSNGCPTLKRRMGIFKQPSHFIKKDGYLFGTDPQICTFSGYFSKKSDIFLYAQCVFWIIKSNEN